MEAREPLKRQIDRALTCGKKKWRHVHNNSNKKLDNAALWVVKKQESQEIKYNF